MFKYAHLLIFKPFIGSKFFGRKSDTHLGSIQSFMQFKVCNFVAGELSA
jgi:hypothetical protein